jgi:geranylgeranyl pyrophosphate synthase
MAMGTKVSSEVQRDIYEVYVQEMINLSMGQAMDIVWHRGIANADTLDEHDYLQMCAYKTGTLARMAAKMAATGVHSGSCWPVSVGRRIHAFTQRRS